MKIKLLSAKAGRRLGVPTPPNPKKDGRREASERRFQKAIERERAIGINPKYLHSHARMRAASSLEWLAAANAWEPQP
jgi:hypothetical protein